MTILSCFNIASFMPSDIVNFFILKTWFVLSANKEEVLIERFINNIRIVI